MARLYVLGGRQRKPGIKEPAAWWQWYEAALILEVDTESGAVRTCVEYQTPLECRAHEKNSTNFHAGAIVNSTLYTCTPTEVLIYRLPDFKQTGYISLPSFNDLHHVTPCSDGNLLVVSTGVDMVIKCTVTGEVLEEWSSLEEAPWTRFSRSTDYRKVETTKPHQSHPNYVFELDGEPWVTRFMQKDAVSLNGSKRRIDIAVEKPHDGVLFDEKLYFTAVDGKVVIVNGRTLTVDKVVDLRQIQDHDGQKLPAWCRGLLPVDQSRIWVGFSRIRNTLLKENLRWVKVVLHEGTLVKPTHIALFDIDQQKCLDELDLEPFGMNAVYGILPAG